MRRFLPLLIASALVLVASSAFAAAPYYAPGAYQAWDIGTAAEMKDDGVAPDAAAADGIYTATVNIAVAGVYEWKAAEAAWTASWPATGNAWLITTADNQDVVLTFDENVYADGWSPDSFWPHSDKTRGATYTLVGSLGDELGGTDWDPAGVLVMTDDGLGGDMAAGDGIYSFCGSVAVAGTHEWKVAVNAGWGQQFGSDGPSINAGTLFVTVDNDNDPWCFELDTNTGRIRAYPNAPVPVDAVSWGQLKSK